MYKIKIFRKRPECIYGHNSVQSMEMHSNFPKKFIKTVKNALSGNHMRKLLEESIFCRQNKSSNGEIQLLTTLV